MAEAKQKHTRLGVALIAVWVIFISLAAYSGLATFDSRTPPGEIALIILLGIAIFIIYSIGFRLRKRFS